MAADTILGDIQGLLDGVNFKQTAYALDRDSRKAALAPFLRKASEEEALKVGVPRFSAYPLSGQVVWRDLAIVFGASRKNAYMARRSF